MRLRLGLTEQDDAAHLGLFVNNPEQRIQPVTGLHRVDVILLLHDQFDALIGGSAHHVCTSISRHSIATGQDFNRVLLPEAVDERGLRVQEHDGAVGSLGVDNAVLVFSGSVGSNLVADDGRADDERRAAGGHRDNAERLQLASVALGDVMHRVNSGNREAIASGNAGRGRHGDRLVTVVHVETLGRCGRAGDGLGHPVVRSGVTGINRDARTSSSGKTLRVVHLGRAKACDLADEGAVISSQRFRRQCLTTSEVACHAVVITGGKRQVAVEVLYALLVHNGLALGDVIKAFSSRHTLYNERSLSRSDIQHSDVDVGGQLPLGGITKALFLKCVTQFSCAHYPRHRLVESNPSGHSELRVVAEIGGHVRTRVGTRHIGLRPPDGVVGALHHRLIRVVDRDVAGQHKGVLEAFQEVFERYAFFFVE